MVDEIRPEFTISQVGSSRPCLLWLKKIVHLNVSWMMSEMVT